MTEKYFPQGVATGASFCNREDERASLKSSIETNEHTVLVAPRRYGKTSLITQVLRDVDYLSTSMDFFFVLTHAEACKQITEGVTKLINDILPKSKTACSKVIDAVKALNPKLTLSLFGQKLEISTKQTTEKTISELLLALDHFATRLKKTCVVVLDEFQQIGELKENHAIEAAIRHAVERSQKVSYIFLGSKRHLLNEMFSDKSRPLYHLCDLMPLERINSKHYKLFLNKQSKKHWKTTLEDDVISEILFLTENHPFYVNALCRRLWRHEKIINVSDVQRTWKSYVSQQAAWIMNDFSSLTLNRRKVITALASHPTKEPQGTEFSQTTGINPSGIKKCIVYLEQHDYIYVDMQGMYRIFDPAVGYFIRESSI